MPDVPEDWLDPKPKDPNLPPKKPDDPRLDAEVPDPGLKQSPSAKRYYLAYRALGVVRWVGAAGAFVGIPHAGKLAKVGDTWKPLERGGEEKKGWLVRVLEWLLSIFRR